MMKRISILLTLIIVTNYLYSQACGVYYIKYIGEVQSEGLEIISVKLPTASFLHGLETDSSEFAFIETDIKNNQIELLISSHLTSHLYEEANTYEKIYSTERESIPIIFIISKNDKQHEVTLYKSWEDINIKMIKKGSFNKTLEIDLKEIHLKL